jgi:MOB kinase activator 1
MASFITTMFVPLESSPVPQPLPPHCTLKQSSSCVTINTYSILNSPEPAYFCPSPPVAQHLRDGFNSSVVDSSSPYSNARTRGQFKPQRANKGTTSYQLRQFAEATLGSGSLRKAVKLPEGEDLNEWLAVNSGHQSTGRLACANPDFSRRFLQSDQPALRLDHRVLLATVMSRNESDR